jgi:hypothetical protein
MNNNLFKVFVFIASLFAVTNATAQSFSIGDAVGAPDDAVSVSVVWDAEGGSYNGMEFRVDFNNALLTFTGCTLNAPYASYQLAICQLNDANTVEVGLVSNLITPTAVPSGNLGTINFTIANSATPQVTPLPGNNAVLPGNPVVEFDPGQVTIQGPAYSSNPASSGATEFQFVVIQNAADPSLNLTITNTGVGTLSGTCTDSSDPDGVFTVTNGAFSAGAGLNDSVTVACDSAGTITTHTGTLSCTHNGGNVASPVEYDLSCNITAGPQPAYTSSNPTAGGAINLGPTEAGDPDPTQTMTITNTGDASTNLQGTCTMGAGDTEISLTTTGDFSIPQGSPGSQKTVSCDASVQGNYSRTLSCSHNGSSPASPVDYTVNCEITEAGGAVFASNPVPGPIDVDNGADVVVGDTDPTRQLTLFNNADQGDQQLDIGCSLAGDAAITVQPDISGGILIAPGSSSAVTFTCDTASASDYTATYTCSYQNGGVDAPVGEGTQVVYNLSCGVREPEAQVETDPPSGTPQNAAVSPGGSTSFSFDFTEINDEGEDGQLHDCHLVTTGQGFTINPYPVEAAVLSGQTVTVNVDFTDPTGADSWSDTLECEFSDSDNDDTIVSWPLTVTIGGNAQITVLKDFTDDNPGEVTVELDCNTGLILDQSKDITEDGIGVTFVVTDYDAGELDCSVTEVPVAGYSADYEVSGDSEGEAFDDPDEDAGCHWADMEGGVENTCTITNSPDPVDVVVNKEWIIEGTANATDMGFGLDLYCEASGMSGPNAHNDGGDSWHGYATSEGNDSFTWSVTPFYPSSTCYVEEYNLESYVEVDNGCTNITISAGNGAECTVTNSVFYEGIPTLSQYGMMLMALLMLGVGFVSVRRYS